MADPGDGVAADGTIRTGARRSRVPAIVEPVLNDALTLLGDAGASPYVDLLSVDLPTSDAVGRLLSARYADSGGGAPRLKLGCGTRASGRRHRLRCR